MKVTSIINFVVMGIKSFLVKPFSKKIAKDVDASGLGEQAQNNWKICEEQFQTWQGLTEKWFGQIKTNGRFIEKQHARLVQHPTHDIQRAAHRARRAIRADQERAGFRTRFIALGQRQGDSVGGLFPARGRPAKVHLGQGLCLERRIGNAGQLPLFTLQPVGMCGVL